MNTGQNSERNSINHWVKLSPHALVTELREAYVGLGLSPEVALSAALADYRTDFAEPMAKAA